MGILNADTLTREEIKRLILALSIQAEIDGMKVENSFGGWKRYSQEDFKEKAMELRNLANTHSNDL